ncbi:DEAD/DEAH box helicase [Pyrodictium delaneyi]|uniref:ATP-dependent helicase n=1 Tax=Pyrodictium delaneyi TaxID=1273541 RepID=A0A211YR09_9CREN|nr:DEAD/DEAH box helicase [Pyrodictium delaneyi]OWJ55334.1 hypothetical protein Pdsh_00475 [Pyrodictium delaneyi]
MNAQERIEKRRVSGAFRLLHPLLQRVLEKHGYVKPTEIQDKAIPEILRGNNVLVIAPTGSGKTEAALLPVLSRLIGVRSRGIYCIYITPLRSLNRDIFKRMSGIASSLGLDLEVRHGDSTTAEKRRFLENPPHIMVTTPESFYFLLSVEKFRHNINNLKYIVIDEIHELVSDKRGAELSLALERVARLYTKARLQLIGLSATVSNPYLVAKLIMGERYVRIIEAEKTKKRYSILVTAPGDSSKNSNNDTNSVRSRVHNETLTRVNLIKNILAKSRGNVIVFANTRDTAEVLGALLKQVVGDEFIEVHHGSLSRDKRVDAEQKLKSGKIKALVATSSLELGIDIGSIDLVIQYMSPRQVVKLVQRVGRAGHRAGSVSRGVIVASNNIFDILESAVIAARAMRGNLENIPLYNKPYDALIHQVAGMIIESGEIDVNKLYNVITSSGYYRDLSIDELYQILYYMDSSRIARAKESRVSIGSMSKSYYFSVTMIPDTRQYNVYEVASGKKLGVLDEEFVATLEKEDKFVLGGRVWEVVDISEDHVRVKPAREDRLIPPAWEGDLIPVEYGVARELGSILRRYEEIGERVLDNYPLDDNARRIIVDRITRHISKGLPLPTDKRIVIEHYGDTFIIYSFLGSRGNKALEYLLSAYISEIKGYSPVTTSTPYIVAVRLASHERPSFIADSLMKLASFTREDVDNLLRKAIYRSRLYQWILLYVALRAGAVKRTRETNLKQIKTIILKLKDTILGEEAYKEINVRKVDINALYSFLERIRNKKVEVRTVSLRITSPITEDAVAEARFGDRVSVDSLPSTILVEAIKRKLSSKEVIFLCVMCGKTWSRRLSHLSDKIECPRCGARMIYPALSRERIEVAKIVLEKIKHNSRLSNSEKKLSREVMDAAGLVLNYGKKAIEALVSTGVGVHTAKRVLQKLVFGEEAFYRALVEAEVKYHKYKHRLEK